MAWRTGWIPIRDERSAETRLHKPWPEHPGHTLCGRPVRNPGALVSAKPPGLLVCLLCQQYSRRARPTAEPRPRDGGDQHDRRQARGGSVRALRGGLPGLGKRR